MMSAALAATAFCANTPAMAAELLTNGNFETGTFAGWTVANQAGSNGTWYVDAPGTTTPSSGFATSANASGGSFYALTDQTGAGAHALLQSFVVGAGLSSMTLSYQLFANNYGSQTIKSTLDYNGATVGYYRVDILNAGADAFSTAAGDIAQSIIVATGSNGVNPYGANTVALNLAAGTYQLRFAEADNSGFFNLGVDNVSINAVGGAVPEPATWAMMIAGFGIVGASMRRRKVAVRFA